MAKLIWDAIGERLYETGVNQGVLYPRTPAGIYPEGIAWNGLVSVTESPTGAEPTPLYADNIKYLNLMSAEEFGATIEAFTYPEEFAACDGSNEASLGVYVGQQARQAFGLAYKTLLGNDTDNNDHGYKLHLIYGAMAAPSERAYSTVNDTPEAITFSWELTTTPVVVSGLNPTASLVIDSTKVDSTKLGLLEDMLFGTTEAAAYLPFPDAVVALFEDAAPGALTLDTVVPADEATAVAITDDVVLTFSHKIVAESILIMTDTGDIVAGAKTWNEAGTELTFDPTADLASATTYLVSANGVIDMYGRALAPEVSWFTTAS